MVYSTNNEHLSFPQEILSHLLTFLLFSTYIFHLPPSRLLIKSEEAFLKNSDAKINKHVKTVQSEGLQVSDLLLLSLSRLLGLCASLFTAALIHLLQETVHC